MMTKPAPLRLVSAASGDPQVDNMQLDRVFFALADPVRRKILERLQVRPGVDNVRYAPGAVIWQVDRKDIAKSRMNRIIGTPYYKQITIRSANTMRKLNELTAGPA